MNVFHCFDCGTGHNMLTLYADLCHLTGKDRYKKHIGKFIEESRKNLAERKRRDRQCRKKARELRNGQGNRKNHTG